VASSALEAIAALLDRLGVEWVLFGALAANRYRGQTRTTGDTDVLIADPGAARHALEQSLIAGGWGLLRATPDGSLLRLTHPELGIVDLVVAGTDFERLAMSRARSETVREGFCVRTLTVEDVIVFKLIAGRGKDLDDVDSILLTGCSLDVAYIERWASEWDVLDRWRTLRAQE
jgi:hypothetical protein